jgi:hypothetical protein
MAHELHAVVGVVPKKVTDAGLIYAWQTTNITDVILQRHYSRECRAQKELKIFKKDEAFLLIQN